MRGRELAALVVTLVAVWQPSAARPQTSQHSDVAHVPADLPSPVGLPTSSGVQGTDLILDGTSAVDVRGGAPAVDVQVDPKSLPVDKRTGLSVSKESPGFSATDLGGHFGQNVPALSGGGLGADFGMGSSGFSAGGPGLDFGTGSSGFSAGSDEGFEAGSPGFSAGSGAGIGAGSPGFSAESGMDFGVELSKGSDAGFGVGSPKVPISSQGGMQIKVDDQSFGTSGIGPSKVPLPGVSKTVVDDSFKSHPQSSGGGALGKLLSGHSSSGGGGILNLLSSLVTGLGGSGTHAHKNPLSALGLGSQTLQPFVQLASSSADDIGREANFGLRLLGDEIEFQGQQRLKKVFKGVQQAGRTAGAIGQNTYRGVLQTGDSLGNLAVGTVHNLGEFADGSVSASFDNVSDTLGAFGRLLHDLKMSFLRSIIAQAEAGKVLVDSQSKTTSGAVKDILDDKREVVRDNIRAITGLKKDINSKRI